MGAMVDVTGMRIDQIEPKLIQQIVAEYPRLTLKTLEDTTPVPEFAQLRQSNLTDYEFIVGHCAPRSLVGDNGGYELASLDGRAVRYATPAYQIGEYRPEPEQVIRVEEGDRSFPVTKRGGADLLVHGFDHYAKKPLSVIVKAANSSPVYGSASMTMVGERQESVPLTSQDGLKAWAVARHAQLRSTAFPFQVHMAGEVEKLIVPCSINLAGTRFRETDGQRGTIASIHHEVYRGRYRMVANCLRGEFNP